VVFLGILKKKPQSKLWAFISIALSSVVFGLVHLLNLLESSPAAVLMQIGYSALIGAMCAVVLMKTANIWLCVLLHALFDFCGAIVPTLGQGRIWDPFTVILTVVVAVLVTVYFVFAFVKIKNDECDRIYLKN
jgi:membrane protease YdiL (CAAX protease family)